MLEANSAAQVSTVLKTTFTPKPLAMAPHAQLIAAGGPGQLAIGEAQLFELQQGGGPELRKGAPA